MSGRKEMFTPGPWRIAKRGNLGNTIEADSGKRGGVGAGLPDEGYRTVAMFQSCCSSENYYEQEANAVANAHLIAAAPDLYAICDEIRESFAYFSEWDLPIGFEARLDAALAKARGEA